MRRDMAVKDGSCVLERHSCEFGFYLSRLKALSRAQLQFGERFSIDPEIQVVARFEDLARLA